jgi:hypothetical protein
VAGGRITVSGCGDGDGVLASIDRPDQAADCSGSLASLAPVAGCVLGIGLSL